VVIDIPGDGCAQDTNLCADHLWVQEPSSNDNNSLENTIAATDGLGHTIKALATVLVKLVVMPRPLTP
jgi:hypothetical protein